MATLFPIECRESCAQLSVLPLTRVIAELLGFRDLSLAEELLCREGVLLRTLSETLTPVVREH